jgi:acetylornithine deacetylase/succinyl-diaminopimelate desuccinylase-like protein
MFIPITVVAAYFRTLGRLPLNVVFLIEGEEEIGSPSLVPFVTRERERLRADLVVSADGGMWRADHPSTMVSTRGMLKLEFSLRGAAKDLHSGRHGGGLANPLHALAELVASLHDADGRVAVDGFYDAVQPIPEAWRASARALPFTTRTTWRRSAPRRPSARPASRRSSASGTARRSSSTACGAATQGEGSKTVLPSEAHAKITCRLVADQDPADLRRKLERHLREHLPPGVTLDDRPGRATAPPPTGCPTDHPGLRAVLGSCARSTASSRG